MTISGADDEWPTIDELKRLLDVTSDDWDATLDLQLDAAIAQVKLDVGAWDELVDIPDAALGRAAIRMAVLMRSNADAGTPSSLAFADSRLTGLGDDPIYKALLKGHHRRFAFS